VEVLTMREGKITRIQNSTNQATALQAAGLPTGHYPRGDVHADAPDVGVAEAARGVDQHQRPLAKGLVGDPVPSQPRESRLQPHRSSTTGAPSLGNPMRLQPGPMSRPASSRSRRTAVSP
jgi:hypothetical protein